MPIIHESGKPKKKKTKGVDGTLNIPDYSNYMGFMLDREKILDAIQQLGITFQVNIKWSSGLQKRGAHRWFGKRQLHGITISHYRKNGSRGISETLWHELVHCMQTESFNPPSEFTIAYSQYGKTGNVYLNNPYEVEAREIAKQKVDNGFLLTIEE